MTPSATPSFPPSADQFRMTELHNESDVDQILVSICGFGSLPSEKSARSTFPDLINFRVAKLLGFRHVYAHVAPIFFQRRIAKLETKVFLSTLDGKPYEHPAVICEEFLKSDAKLVFLRKEIEQVLNK